jgi:hypothetical protein
MAPVAALIFIRPRIKVNAVERDSLDTDGDCGNARPHVAIEAVLIHAEVRGCIPKSQEAGRRLFVVSPHVSRQRVVPVAQGQVVT